MNKKSQLQFALRSAVLLESGVSLAEVLTIIIHMEKSRKRLAILSAVLANVEKGISLSRSLVIAQAKFEPMLASMISYGESSGILALSLRQAAEMMEKKNDIKKKIIGALIYPGFILVATIGMTLFLVMYIFPKIIPLFLTMNIELPLLTRAVRKLYESILNYGMYGIILGILLIGTFCYLYFSRKHLRFRRLFHRLFLGLPTIGSMLQKYFLCGYCRSTATLLECGQFLPHILEQLSASSTFEPYKDAWHHSKREIERGIALSTSLRNFKTIFPIIVPDMLSIGERTGSLSTMFHHISRMYEQELEDFVKQLSVTVEPVLMIGMGLIVGSVALSIILPIYEITNHLTK